MTFKNYFLERVSSDCSTGGGVIPAGPWKGFKVIRTYHLDDKRPPDNKERDEGFTCNTFDALINALIQKMPKLKDNQYIMFWKNNKGYQVAVIVVNNQKKKIVFKTIIQQNKPKSEYRLNTTGKKIIDIGFVPEPRV